jgi:hypothetical protein
MNNTFSILIFIFLQSMENYKTKGIWFLDNLGSLPRDTMLGWKGLTLKSFTLTDTFDLLAD